ncbi:MAG: prepilin-type N-terminal cleavage/methylation domain-containing protein [Rhodoferax sp.]
MKQVQRGFTLIELVMVIVILGVLAAVAVPKFVNLKTDAQVAATQGVAGSLNSAFAINYAARSVSPTNPATAQILAATTCSAAADAVLQGGKPAGYNYTGTAPNCTVTNQDYATASYSYTAILIN